jgi:iron(III) transport system permease protein
MLLFAGVPVASLMYKAGVIVTQTNEGLERSWSLWQCLTTLAVSPWRFGREIGRSLLIGAATASASLLIAVVFVWLARCSRLVAAMALVLCVAGLAVPGPLVGVAVIALFDHPALPWVNWLYDRTIAAPVAAQVFRGLPIVMFLMWHAMRTVPTELLDAAAVDGLGRWAIFFRVVLPMRRTTLALTWLCALVLSLGELSATVLVVPPGVEPLSVRIFGLLHYNVEDQLAGISLTLLLACLGMAALINIIGRRVKIRSVG